MSLVLVESKSTGDFDSWDVVWREDGISWNPGSDVVVLSNSVGYPVKRDHYYGFWLVSDVQNPQAYVRLHHGSTSQNSANAG